MNVHAADCKEYQYWLWDLIWRTDLSSNPWQFEWSNLWMGFFWGLFRSFSIQRKLGNVCERERARERGRGYEYIWPKGMQLIKWNTENRMWTHHHWHWITLPFTMCICLAKLHRSLFPYLWPPWEFWSLKLQRGQRRITKHSLLDALPSILLIWSI